MTEMKRKPQKAPAGVAAAGRGLWRQITDVYDVDAHEVPHLVEACRLADRIAELEELIATDGLTTRGSAGQVRLNPAVAEVRQSRLALARCLGYMSFPDASSRFGSAASLRGRRAAEARWRRTS